MTKQKGFTMIEVLIAVSIIGIIVSVAIPCITGHRLGAHGETSEVTCK